MNAEVVLSRPVLHPGQQQVIDEARRFNVLRCGRRFGKTTLGEELVIDPALDGYPTAWFAPTYKLLSEPWRDITRDLHEIASDIRQQDRRIELIGGGSIDFWSLDNPDAGRGYKYKRAIIDEAGIIRDLRDAWQGAIRPTLTDFEGDAWFLGTPKGRNYFNQLYGRGQENNGLWKSWSFHTVHNPHISADEVDAAKLDMPEDIFRQEYEGEPAEDGGNPFGIDAIRKCIASLSREPVVAWGWDLAKSTDWTVGIGLDAKSHVAQVERWQGPWETTLTKIKAATGRTPALVDSTGVGDPILEALQKNGGQNFEGFKFSAPSKQQIMEGLAVAIQQQGVHYPEGVIVNELEAFEYEYTRTGVRYSAPEGLHDDAVCALALAVAKKGQPIRAPRSGLI